MFKILQRLANGACYARHSKLSITRIQNYASLQMRDLFFDKYEEGGTLFVDFAKHIAIERQKLIEPLPTTIKYANYFPISDTRYFRRELEKTPPNQLAALFIFAATYRTNAQPDKLLSMIHELDEVSVKQLGKMGPEEILNTLYGLLYFAPYWLTRMDFYRLGLEKLSESFQGNEPTEVFVQLCFYLGLQKKKDIVNTNQFKHILDQHLDKYLPRLSLMDLAIITNAAYKTSTLIDSGLFNEILEKQVIEFKLDGRNDGLLINFIKAMRFQRINSIPVCELICQLCEDPKKLDMLQLAGLGHLFVYLAENLWDHPASIKALKESFMKKLLRENHQSRAKDIGMFTWSSAQLNVSLTNDEVELLEKTLNDKINDGKFKYFPDQLIDSCFSLWVLGHKSEDLLVSAIRTKTNLKQKLKHQPKVDSRLTVLLTAAAIEKPDWVQFYTNVNEAFDKNSKVPSYILKQNTELYGLMESLSANKSIKSVRMVMPLNGINIPNLLVELSPNSDESKEIFIELLKPEHILQFSQEQTSIIRLKKRLLESFGYKVISVNAKDIQDNSFNLKEIFGIKISEETEKKEEITLSN